MGDNSVQKVSLDVNESVMNVFTNFVLEDKDVAFCAFDKVNFSNANGVELHLHLHAKSKKTKIISNAIEKIIRQLDKMGKLF